MYDEIFEMIQESYNNGEITFEEATELNDAVYEKYVLAEESVGTEENVSEEQEEDMSIEERCALINEYLKESEGAIYRADKALANELNNKVANANKVHGKARIIADKKAEDATKKINNLRGNRYYNDDAPTPSEMKDQNNKAIQNLKKNDPAAYKQVLHETKDAKTNKRIARKFIGPDTSSEADKIREIKENLKKMASKKGTEDGDITRTYDKNATNTVEQNRKKYTKESVTDTKLAVYEAFDAGQITFDEKETLLQLLSE